MTCDKRACDGNASALGNIGVAGVLGPGEDGQSRIAEMGWSGSGTGVSSVTKYWTRRELRGMVREMREIWSLNHSKDSSNGNSGKR